MIYSDAEFEPGSGKLPKLGWVLFPTDGGQAIGHAMVLPTQVWETWSPRKHQIFPAEAVALTLATWALHHHIR